MSSIDSIDFKKTYSTTNSTSGVNVQGQNVLNSIMVSNSQNENDDTNKIAKAKALGDLMNSLGNIKSSGKPVVHAFDNLLAASIGKLQFVIEEYTSSVAGLQSEMQDPKSSEQRVQEIKNEINQLKDKAKGELNNIYNVIYAMEEVSDILFKTYGNDVDNVPIDDDIKSMLSNILNSSSTSNPEEIKNTVQKLIEKYKEQKSQKTNSNPAVSSVSAKKSTLNTLI